VSDRHSDEHLRRRYGISRRELLRRGAIVGGTLAWTIPVISSISRAHQAKGSPLATCCYCRPKDAKTHEFEGRCAPPSVDTQSQCSRWCRQNFPGEGNPRSESKPEFHSRPQVGNNDTNQIPCFDDTGCQPH